MKRLTFIFSIIAIALVFFGFGPIISSNSCRYEPVETLCSDGCDNDNDGFIDGEDSDCVGGGPDAYDTLTDSDTTALPSHTSDSTHTWTQNGGGGLQIYNNRVESTQSTSVGLYYSSYTPADAAYSVQMDITASGSAVPPVPAVRCSTSVVTMYMVRWDGVDTWDLYKVVSGSPSVIAEYVGDSPVTSTREVKLSVSGSATTNLVVTIDGTERINYNDSSSPITDAGRPGIGTYYCDAAGSHIFYADDWEVVD